MTSNRLLVTVAVVGLALVYLAGCNPSSEPAPDPLDDLEFGVEVEPEEATAGDWEGMTWDQKRDHIEHWLDFYSGTDVEPLPDADDLQDCVDARVGSPENPSTMMVMAMAYYCMKGSAE